MRWMFALLALVVACGSKKEPPKQQASGSASGSAPIAALDALAAVPVVDAPAGPVELLRSYTAFVEVSSHVKNKTIKPEHIADGDFNTAWNSKTGELAGAWLEVYVVNATVNELRMTVGHTGKGPKGEDYFTMNPRIKKLTVLDGDKVLVSVTLDPEKRDLQTIALPKPMTTRVRLRVDEVVPGSKKTWREVCVSEIEAWGTPPPNAKPEKRTPIVSVFNPNPPSAHGIVYGKPADWSAVCEKITAPLQEAFDERQSKRSTQYEDEDAPPECGLRGDTPINVAPWKSVSIWRVAENSAHGPMTCNLFVHTDHGDFFIGGESACGPWDDESIELASATAEDVIPGGLPELVLRYATTRGEVPVELVVCRYTTAVQCTQAFVIETADYKVEPRFTKGTVAFDPIRGKPPAEVSGPVALSFD